jgi:large repetitive protein
LPSTAPNDDVTVTVGVINGTLTVTAGTGALTTATGSGSATVTLTGTVAEVNAALEGLTYAGTANFNGNDTVTVTINDNGATGADPGLTGTATNEQATATIALTVTPIPDAPVSAAVTANGAEGDTSVTGITLSAVDTVDGGAGANDQTTITTHTITTLPDPALGRLFFADGTTSVPANTPITVAQATNMVFVPANENVSGAITFTYISTDADNVSVEI